MEAAQNSTKKDQKCEEKVLKKGKTDGYFDFFSRVHTATGLTQWTISLYSFYLFKLYSFECF